MVVIVKDSYRMIPNWDIRNGNARLRTCDAEAAIHFMENHKVHPKDVPSAVKKNLTSKTVVSHVVNENTNTYKYRFRDNSMLIWLHDLERYAIQYPEICKITCVPVTIPKWKDIVSNLASTEADLVREVQDVRKKSKYPFAEWDERLLADEAD